MGCLSVKKACAVASSHAAVVLSKKKRNASDIIASAWQKLSGESGDVVGMKVVAVNAFRTAATPGMPPRPKLLRGAFTVPQSSRRPEDFGLPPESRKSAAEARTVLEDVDEAQDGSPLSTDLGSSFGPKPF